jgi:superfamily I DNA/RNA helicase
MLFPSKDLAPSKKRPTQVSVGKVVAVMNKKTPRNKLRKSVQFVMQTTAFDYKVVPSETTALRAFVADLDHITAQCPPGASALQALDVIFERFALGGCADAGLVLLRQQAEEMKGASIEAFLDAIKVAAAAADEKEAELEVDDDDFVRLLSIHRAKGLEFKTVFCIRCVEGCIPMARVAECRLENPTAYREARRLMYVAVTRAMERMYCSSIGHWEGHEMAMSPFLAELGI